MKSMLGIAISICLMMLFIIPAQAADPCDRECLEGYIDQVLDAMIAHNPSQLSFAHGVQYTENGVELRIGDGMWGTLVARGNYSLYISDVETGQAGFFGTVSENGLLNYIALRVKVDEALISEIEAIVTRPEEMMALDQPKPETPGERMEARSVRPQFTRTVPPEERLSREELIKIANSYFTGLANQTGNYTAPFCETCERWENGLHTTNQEPRSDLPPGGLDILAMDCKEQQKSGWFAFVTEIRDRRYPIVDVERGLVLSFGFFDHDAAVREYPLPDGTMTPNILTFPQTIEIAELFQIDKGKIDQIEAVINKVPYRMKSDVWDE